MAPMDPSWIQFFRPRHMKVNSRIRLFFVSASAGEPIGGLGGRELAPFFRKKTAEDLGLDVVFLC